MVTGTVAARHPDAIPTGTPLSASLKGSVIYGAILIGAAGDEDPTVHSSSDKEVLYSFLEVPEDDEEPVPDTEETEPSEVEQ